ncbi:biotin carboxyl carrier protein of acetyl-CoA carboxylase 2, chloroplastic-like [Camellia sinensis]|uniref:biotin carboxyl carrier protein of acetyl-CoA carboxylase 2, chloroplastic-like n=1 Tax=Camellia sinensis TaxID=4442 RepID=UPI0010369953|nr:biotin carboxyl carrier protein of acetyl-CoA carboxylase 2, chloroplastic-like [Camellia sinensis]
MASFSVPCPKSSALFTASSSSSQQQPNPKQTQHCLVSFPSSSSALLAGSSLRLQGTRDNQSNVSKVFAQLNEVALKSSNCAPVPSTKPVEPAKESPAQNTVPDASSISAFMTQVADLVELVDSRDIMELHLKQLDCEVIIRKKEALQQPPVVMMQPASPQTMAPYQPPPAQVNAPAGPVPSAPASAPALPSPAKPKSSHPPLKCPMAGTFYRSPAPGTPPFIKVGDKIQKGQVVCIIEAMKLMNEIEADQSGTVVEIIAEDGKPVSVDTPLFVIEP